MHRPPLCAPRPMVNVELEPLHAGKNFAAQARVGAKRVYGKCSLLHVARSDILLPHLPGRYQTAGLWIFSRSSAVTQRGRNQDIPQRRHFHASSYQELTRVANGLHRKIGKIFMEEES